MDSREYQELTGVSLEPTLNFARYLSDIGKPMWIRHVLVPGITDRDEYLEKLADFQANLYKELSGDNFDKKKYDKLIEKPLQCSHVISIGVKKTNPEYKIEMKSS